MTMRKGIHFALACLLALGLAMVPDDADARAGSNKSSGSRGSKTYTPPPATTTAPNAVKPVERSVTPAPAQQPQAAQPQAAPKPAAAAPAAPAAQPSFFQRNPFLSGLMGGMLGAGLVGMLMGGGFGGFAGGAGFLGLLLQIAVIGGLGYLLYSFFRKRQEQNAEGHALAGGPKADLNERLARIADAPIGSSAAQAADVPDKLGLGADDYDSFERLLLRVQSAWSKGDIESLKDAATEEMLGYFRDDLAENKAKGMANKVDEVRLEQGDLAEAWADGTDEYATVALRWSGLDRMVSLTDGKVVEGNEHVRTEATEIWTFRRHTGGTWTLSAIQQVE
jgi:predicted lipid-binding transport protein (Tim44 family)